jgi:hypothetical protein
VQRRLAHHVGRTGQRFTRREFAPPPKPAGDEEQQDEDDVDDAGGGLEEVVVVRGDELAELVDEEAKADAAEHRRDPAHLRPVVGQQQADREEHQHPAPQEVGDVQLAPAELGIVRRPQLQPDHQDGGHGAHEHGVLLRSEIQPPGGLVDARAEGDAANVRRRTPRALVSG